MKVLPIVCLAFAIGCSPIDHPIRSIPSGALVDLSHDYSDRTVYWPTAEGFRLRQVAAGMTAGGYYYAANDFSTSEHGGTHLDAPVHFAEGRQAVDEIPLERLVGNAIVIDISSRVVGQPDYRLTREDIAQWERANGAIAEGTIVLVRTDWSRSWPDARRYLGTEERGAEAVAKLHFPGIHPESARWLVERQVKAVGIDTASVDYGQSTLFETHRVLYESNIPGFENLMNLDRLPPRGAFVVALPMKIKGGTGAPLRAVAFLP